MNFIERFSAWIGSKLFPVLAHDIDDLRRELVEVRSTLSHGLNVIDARHVKESFKPKTGYVVLQSSVGMLSSRVALRPDADREHVVRFRPQMPIPAGAWIMVIGDVHITNVCVGNQAQYLSAGIEAPFCITRDALEIGCCLSVTVKGNEQ